jgi:hypothetical protein
MRLDTVAVGERLKSALRRSRPDRKGHRPKAFAASISVAIGPVALGKELFAD